MKFDDKVPIYYQIKQYIYRQIIVAELEPGQKLPAIRQLAVTLTVNVNTIQRALGELIEEGIIIPQRGKGNFVTTDLKALDALKKTVVDEELARLYDHLTSFKITSDEMVQYLENYINKRKEEQHD